MMVWSMFYLSTDCGGHGATYGARFRGEMALKGPKTATDNCKLLSSCCALHGYVNLSVPSNKVHDTVFITIRLYMIFRITVKLYRIHRYPGELL